MQYLHQYGTELEELFAKTAKNKKLLHDFLFDLLSPAEYKDLAVRWQIVKQLNEGLTHREISENLNIGVATVARGAREMMDKHGGFRQILNKYYKTKTAPR